MQAFKLYELSDSFNRLSDMIEDGTEGLEDTLESIECSFQEKVESIIKLWRSKIAERDVIKLERLRLEQREKALDKSAEWLKTYVENQMKFTGIVKVPSSLFTITLADNAKSVDVLDESLIPSQYIRSNLVTSPDKAAIKAAIENGEEVPGAALKQTQSLRVR